MKSSWFNSSDPATPEVLRLGRRRFTLTATTAASFAFKYPVPVFGTGLKSLQNEYIFDSDREDYKPQLTVFDIRPHCGYFTFVPLLTESCGSITRWTRLIQPSDSSGNPEEPVCILSGKNETYGNQCVTYPHLQENGNPSGYTTVVKLNCDTGLHLPLEQQDTIYASPGVMNEAFGADGPWMD
ncbi:hypothetical protein TWF696_008497 [Orbilia brochopaga]|uniref:Uncharacterized protein n=1 Tax=Orbilia brochopaga TaxID=3140254 RepID=A0AAV9UH04_9PEZI